MRSGWPHTQDDQGMLQADERRAPFGPEISWPTGYSNLEYRDGEYRYPASNTPQPPANYGEHPYGYGDSGGGGYAQPSVADYGYGDPGYSDLGYDGPAAQDAGIAGTRTVRGFVEAGPAPAGYAQPGYEYSAPTAADYTSSDYRAQDYRAQDYTPGGYTAQDYRAPEYAAQDFAYPAIGYHESPSIGYEESSAIELAYPLQSEAYPPANAYSQPWDYDQPLRYEDEAPSYPALESYQQRDTYTDSGSYGSGSYGVQAYNPGDYNGSDLSMPGINGPGYDLSGIIETGDFEAVGYDEPSYGRLAYDDPRYDDARYDDKARHSDYGYDAPAADVSRDPSPGPRYDDTSFDLPRYEDTRLDSLWLGSEDTRQEDEPVGYENDGFGADGPFRSGYPDSGPQGRHAYDETRFDLRVDDLQTDHTRFDMPAYDETRVEDMRALRSDFRRSSTSLLPPPEQQPLNWPDETTIDALVADLYLDDEPEQQFPAAYVRTLERREQPEDTGSRRTGRRRGRSGDRRQWMALGAIAVVAAGAIGGVLMKYVFAGPSGPAHTVVAPNQADGYTRMANLEREMKVDQLRDEVIKTSAGQASGVVSAVYQQGSTAPGSTAQIFMFVGGKLASAAPATSIANFTQTYPGATVVPAGTLGGEAACAEATTNGQGVAMCVWFDNDSFGELVSPTMTTAKLAATLDQVRPSLELYTK